MAYAQLGILNTWSKFNFGVLLHLKNLGAKQANAQPVSTRAEDDARAIRRNLFRREKQRLLPIFGPQNNHQETPVLIKNALEQLNVLQARRKEYKYQTTDAYGNLQERTGSIIENTINWEYTFTMAHAWFDDETIDLGVESTQSYQKGMDWNWNTELFKSRLVNMSKVLQSVKLLEKPPAFEWFIEKRTVIGGVKKPRVNIKTAFCVPPVTFKMHVLYKPYLEPIINMAERRENEEMVIDPPVDAPVKSKPKAKKRSELPRKTPLAEPEIIVEDEEASKEEELMVDFAAMESDLNVEFSPTGQEEYAAKDTRSISWCFTINNWTADDYAAIEAMAPRVKYMVVGKEIGEENQVPHLQCYASFKNQITFNVLKKLLPRAHFAVTKAKGKKTANAWLYCMKEGNFKEWGSQPAMGRRMDLQQFISSVQAGVYDEYRLMNRHPDVTAKYGDWARKYVAFTRLEKDVAVPELKLREWELEILKLLKEPVKDRRIIWLWSEDSMTGKSTFMKYLHSVFRREMMSTDELRKRDILFAYNMHKIVHLDLTRDLTTEQRSWLKSTIEALSDNKIHLSSKYGSCEKLISCHVIVTANQPPVDGLPYRYVEFKLAQRGVQFTVTNWHAPQYDDSGNEYFVQDAYKPPMSDWSAPLQYFRKRIPVKDMKYGNVRQL